MALPASVTGKNVPHMRICHDGHGVQLQHGIVLGPDFQLLPDKGGLGLVYQEPEVP